MKKCYTYLYRCYFTYLWKIFFFTNLFFWGVFFLCVNFNFFYRQPIHHITCTEQDKHIISVNDSYCYLCAQHITTFFSEINCNCNYHPNPPKPLYIYNDQNDKIVTNSLYILFLLRV